MSAPVLITEAPRGTPASSIGVLAQPDLSVVTYVPGESSKTAAGAAAVLLSALGKNSDVNGKSRSGYDDVVLVSLWLTAHRTTDVLAVAPQHTPRQALSGIAAAMSASPARLWLACDHGYADAITRALQHTAPIRVPWPDLPATRPAPPAAPTDTWNPDTPAILPSTEFLTFRAEARRLLDPQKFAAVDALHRQSMLRTLLWLDRTGPDNVEEPAVRQVLTELLSEQHTLDETTVAVSAAQAAFFLRGWHLSIDPRELRAGLLRFPASDVPDSMWQRVRAYRSTERALIVALYLAGLTPNEIRALSVSDLTRWHAEPDGDLAGHTIPEPAWPYLRAHLLARTLDTPAPADPLLEVMERRVVLDLRQAQDDLGLNLGEANINADSAHGSRRVNARALKLVRLT